MLEGASVVLPIGLVRKPNANLEITPLMTGVIEANALLNHSLEHEVWHESVFTVIRDVGWSKLHSQTIRHEEIAPLHVISLTNRRHQYMNICRRTD